MSRRPKSNSPSGVARGGDTPTFAERPARPLREYPAPPELIRAVLGPSNSYLRTYGLGECSVIVTREFGNWHLSIAHPLRYPTWDEIAEARYRILPDGVTMAMLLPPRAEYVNVNPNCFQLFQVDPGGPS